MNQLNGKVTVASMSAFRIIWEEGLSERPRMRLVYLWEILLTVLNEMGRPAYCGWHHPLCLNPGLYRVMQELSTSEHICASFLCYD